MPRVKEEAARMKEALLRGNFDDLVRTMRRGWEAKKGTANIVSNTAIDLTMEAALAAGAKAGKVSGAGGGGYLILLVDPSRRVEVQRALIKRGGDVVSFQFSRHGAQGWRVD
jgi:D-glycero-alpha-D-manno-heptose-7-phosphate kinase